MSGPFEPASHRAGPRAIHKDDPGSLDVCEGCLEHGATIIGGSDEQQRENSEIENGLAGMAPIHIGAIHYSDFCERGPPILTRSGP